MEEVARERADILLVGWSSFQEDCRTLGRGGARTELFVRSGGIIGECLVGENFAGNILEAQLDSSDYRGGGTAKIRTSRSQILSILLRGSLAA